MQQWRKTLDPLERRKSWMSIAYSSPLGPSNFDVSIICSPLGATPVGHQEPCVIHQPGVDITKRLWQRARCLISIHIHRECTEIHSCLTNGSFSEYGSTHICQLTQHSYEWKEALQSPIVSQKMATSTRCTCPYKLRSIQDQY